jgi:hypothetical protein
MKPGFHGVRAHWIRGSSAFRMAPRNRIVMLLVPLCPESGFLDAPPDRSR